MLASCDCNGKGAHRKQRGQADNEPYRRAAAARPFGHAGLYRRREADVRLRNREQHIGPPNPARPSRPSTKTDLDLSDSALRHDDRCRILAPGVSPPGIEPLFRSRTGCAEESHEHVARTERLPLPVFLQVRKRPRDSEPRPGLGVERNVRRKRCLDPVLRGRGKSRNGGNRCDEKGKRDESHVIEIIRPRRFFSRFLVRGSQPLVAIIVGAQKCLALVPDQAFVSERFLPLHGGRVPWCRGAPDAGQFG